MTWQRRTALRQISGRGRQERALDKLCRELVVVLRDQSTCQRCLATRDGSPISRPTQIHWAHVVTRNAKSIRWREFNVLALCAGCHSWFDHNKREAWPWFAARFPERALAIDAWRADRHKKRVDLSLEALSLLQQLSVARGERSATGDCC